MRQFTYNIPPFVYSDIADVLVGHTVPVVHGVVQTVLVRESVHERHDALGRGLVPRINFGGVYDQVSESFTYDIDLLFRTVFQIE